ncbi:MAG: hypothetical protein IMZ71_04790 [Chloroflexi bacterium]|nr:hypothetical protein [Chloroflexota bacterium]
MKIERMYMDHPGEWEEIPEETFIRRTEWAGYWKKGTALQTLKNAGPNGIRTPWALFRIKKTLDNSPTLAEVNERRGFPKEAMI